MSIGSMNSSRQGSMVLWMSNADPLMEALLLGRDGVLMKESSQSIDTSDPRTVIETALGNIRDGSLEIDATMRSCFVVVLDKLAKRPLKVTLVADEEPVEALGPCRTNESLSKRICPRGSHRCLDDLGTDRLQHLIEGPNALRVAARK